MNEMKTLTPPFGITQNQYCDCVCATNTSSPSIFPTFPMDLTPSPGLYQEIEEAASLQTEQGLKITPVKTEEEKSLWLIIDNPSTARVVLEGDWKLPSFIDTPIHDPAWITYSEQVEIVKRNLDNTFKQKGYLRVAKVAMENGKELFLIAKEDPS
jgi:hypothetical protein